MAGTYIIIMFTGHLGEVTLYSGTLQLLLNFTCTVEWKTALVFRKSFITAFCGEFRPLAYARSSKTAQAYPFNKQKNKTGSLGVQQMECNSVLSKL